MSQGRSPTKDYKVQSFHLGSSSGSPEKKKIKSGSSESDTSSSQSALTAAEITDLLDNPYSSFYDPTAEQITHYIFGKSKGVGMSSSQPASSELLDPPTAEQNEVILSGEITTPERVTFDALSNSKDEDEDEDEDEAIQSCVPTPAPDTQTTKAEAEFLRTQTTRFSHDRQGRVKLSTELLWMLNNNRVQFPENLSNVLTSDVTVFDLNQPNEVAVPLRPYKTFTGCSPKGCLHNAWAPVSIKNSTTALAPSIDIKSGHLEYPVEYMGHSIYMDIWCRGITTPAVVELRCPHYVLTYSRYIIKEASPQAALPGDVSRSVSATSTQLFTVSHRYIFLSINEIPRHYNPVQSTPAGYRVTLYRFLQKYRLDTAVMNTMEWRNLLFHVMSALAYLQKTLDVFLRTLTLHDIVVVDARSPSNSRAAYNYHRTHGDRGNVDTRQKNRKNTDLYKLDNIDYYIERGRFTFLLENHYETRISSIPDSAPPAVGQYWGDSVFVSGMRPPFPYSNGAVVIMDNAYTKKKTKMKAKGLEIVSPRNNALQHFLEDLIFSFPVTRTAKQLAESTRSDSPASAFIRKTYLPECMDTGGSGQAVVNAYQNIVPHYLLKPITESYDKSAQKALPDFFSLLSTRSVRNRGRNYTGERPTVIKETYDMNIPAIGSGG